MIECVPAGEVKYYLIVLPQNLPCITAFEATFFEMEVADSAKITGQTIGDFRPTLLKLRQGKMFGPAVGPALATEAQVTAALLRICPSWTISVLEHRIGGLDERLAISRTVISYEQALAHEAQRQAAAADARAKKTEGAAPGDVVWFHRRKLGGQRGGQALKAPRMHGYTSRLHIACIVSRCTAEVSCSAIIVVLFRAAQCTAEASCLAPDRPPFWLVRY